MYGMSLKAHAQPAPQGLSESQYKEINEIIKGARETYSLLCLAPNQDLNEIENKFFSLQAKIDSIIILEAESISSLNQEQPWTLANFSPPPPKEFNFIEENQLLARKDELFQSFNVFVSDSHLNNVSTSQIAMRQPDNGFRYDVPPFYAGTDFERDVFLTSSGDEDSLNSCLESLMIILGQIFNINDDYTQEFISIFSASNSKIYLEGMVKSIISIDYNKLKTFTELFFDEFDKNPDLYDFFKSATSPIAVAILEWIARRCVPIIGLSLALLEILFTLVRHRERVTLCYLSIE